MRHSRILLIVAALVLVASWAVAGPCGGWGGHGINPGYGMPSQSIPDLTPEQSQKLQELRQSYFNEIGPLQNQMFSKRAEMRMLWSKTNPDAAKITAKQQELQQLESQMREKATYHQLELRKILTPEQLAQMPGMGYGMRGHGMMGGGMGGGMRRGW